LAGLNPAANCIVLAGSHYDSKTVEGVDYLGANDSGSSSVLLIDMFRYFKKISLTNLPKCDIAFIWFDGEESVLPDWNDGERKYPLKIKDNTYGSRHFVQKLTPCQFLDNDSFCFESNGKQLTIVSLILFDMIGSADIKYSKDQNSSTSQVKLFEQALKTLKIKSSTSLYSQDIKDDHIPFKSKNISVIDIIDFNHLSYWHKANDSADNISMESIEITAKIGTFLLLSNSYSPKDHIAKTDQ
jgi:Zn-dependent M28 family amino/carboxypeptidase